MSRAPIYWIVLIAGCSGSPQHRGKDGGADLSPAAPDLAGGGDLAPPSGENVVPVIVDNGPNDIGSVDVPFVSVTICVPGTTQCQTIDHISVDTGSTGLRLLSSALTLTLPQASATTGAPLVECFAFADGYTWGSVRNADVKMGGELAAGIPIQLIGDPMFTSVPADCSSTGPSENTIADFGANGLLGINQALDDCGPYCSDTTQIGTGAYYSCNGGSCTAVAVAEPNQLPNPLARFAGDNNGAALQFPTIPATGAATLTGSLLFGIGTRANNGLGAAKVITVDVDGNFTTTFNNKSLSTSFIDSGTNSLSFDDASIPQCGGNDAGWFCPGMLVNLTAQNQGQNGVTTMVQFSVANTDTLFSSNNTAFSTLAGPGMDTSTFDWGFPFFVGRTVFVAFDGAVTPGGKGPYFAY